MNLADAVTYQARRRPHAVALIQDSLTLSFAGLERSIGRAAGALREQGIAPGDVVGVAMTNYILHVVTLLALARLGTVSVGLSAAWPAARRKALAERFRAKAVIAFDPERAVEGIPLIRADPEWLAPRKPVPESGAPAEGGARTWRINVTLDSAGAVQGIPLLHERSLLQARLEQTLIAWRPETRFLCSTDLALRTGLGPCLRHLFAGHTVVMLSEDVPDKFLAAVDRHGVTHAAVMPAALARLAQRAMGGAVRCPGLAQLMLLGTRLPREVREAVLARLTPNLIPSYGVPEAGIVALADTGMAARNPGAAGAVVPWIEAGVVDERDQPVPPGTQGRLRLRGFGLFEGYYDDPKANARSLREGWFYPGDQGRISAGGLLFVSARPGQKAGAAPAAPAAPKDGA